MRRTLYRQKYGGLSNTKLGPKTCGIEELLLKWGSRKLTLFGKVQIINLLALPKLTYFFSILPVSMALIHKIEKILLLFLWGKNHKVKKQSLLISVLMVVLVTLMWIKNLGTKSCMDSKSEKL